MNDVRGAARGIDHPRQVMNLQLVLLILAAWAAFVWGGQAAAEAALYGALTALANTGLLMWRLRRSAQGAQSVRRLLAGAYRSGFERFTLVALLLGLGMGVAGLEPLALTGGFIVVQSGWFLAPLLQRTNT